MTVTTTDRKVNHSGDNSTTQFFYSFKVDDISWLKVFIDDVQQFSGFTILLNDDNIGGSVTFDFPPRLDAIVTLQRVVPQDQLIDYRDEPFPVDTHEAGFDKQTMMIQDLQEQSVRAIGVSPSDDGTTNLTLPPYEPGKLIGWCPDNQALCNLDPPDCPDLYVDPYRQIFGRIAADGTVLKKGGDINFNVQTLSVGVHQIRFAEDITEEYVVVPGQAASTNPGWGSTTFVTSETPSGFDVQTQDDESGVATSREFTFHVVWDVAP